MKVVHILGRFGQGGVEMLLKEMYLNTNNSNFDLEFILLDEEEGVYDDELKKNGANLKVISLNKGFLFFVKNFYRYLKNNDIAIVHSHVQSFSGLILFIAYLAKIKGRITHSHSDERMLNKNVNFIRKIYLKLMSFLLNNFSTDRIACSTVAGKSLYDNNFEILPNAINVEKFETRRADLRKLYLEEFNLNEDNIVIGHVGRFEIVKNHKFILDICNELKLRNSRVKILLFGSGSLLNEISEDIQKLNLQDVVMVVGPRNDVPKIMSHLLNGFLLTSLYEGLPLVLIEAQISGLYCLIPNHISDESVVYEELIEKESLETTPDIWSKKLENNYIKSDYSGYYIEASNSSKYSLNYMIKYLESLYSKYLN